MFIGLWCNWLCIILLMVVICVWVIFLGWVFCLVLFWIRLVCCWNWVVVVRFCWFWLMVRSVFFWKMVILLFCVLWFVVMVCLLLVLVKWLVLCWLFVVWFDLIVFFEGSKCMIIFYSYFCSLVLYCVCIVLNIKGVFYDMVVVYLVN